MKLVRSMLCFAALLSAVLPIGKLLAQARAELKGNTAAITSVLNKSASDWNRGDLKAFATSYKDSPDILFMGATIRHGYRQMLNGYMAGYSTPEKMGKLSFTQLEVQPLDEHFATVTGRFHLERTAAGGGNSNGYFLLVLEQTTSGWKIVRDDSTELPTPSTSAH